MYKIGHINWGDMNCVSQSGKSKKHKAMAENEKISVSVFGLFTFSVLVN